MHNLVWFIFSNAEKLIVLLKNDVRLLDIIIPLNKKSGIDARF